MFKKTRLRLVVLNAVVFFLLLNALGAMLYLYTEHRLYQQVDRTLTEESQHVQHQLGENGTGAPKGGQREAERRIVYLLRDAKGQVQKQVPEGALLPEDWGQVAPHQGDEAFRTVTLGSHKYRVYQMPYNNGTAQMFFNLEQTQEMLDSLLLVIGLGVLVSGLLALLIGLYLANLSLRPIQNAWNKQQEFVADASHELRTPLTVVHTQLERLFRHPSHTIEQESLLISEAMDETRRMSKLVAQLLTLARSDSNEQEIMCQPVSMDAVVERAVNSFQPLAELKDIRLVIDLEHPLSMTGDSERLNQLLVILLDNALKYTQEGGTITVTCKRNANAILLEVCDTGIGIKKEDLPHIFDRFFRGDKMRSRTQEGSGLGLSIAKWIVEAHGGRIRADSELGQGTTVLVRLPLHA